MSEMQTIQMSTRVKQAGPASSRVLEFSASTESPDRSKDIIDVAGWQLDNYIGVNPVFAWSHDYSKLPVGKAISAVKDLRKGALVVRVNFPTIAELCTDVEHPSDEALFADTVYNMYKNGMLNAVSVGFRPIKAEPRKDETAIAGSDWNRGTHYIEQELLEVSAVLVPDNPQALVTMRGMKSFNPQGIKLIEEAMKKSVIPFKHYPLSDENTAWDGPGVVSSADIDDLKIMCAWYDEENADVKSSYKLPHHMGKPEEYKTVWRAVAAAMGALLGARGGVNIPDADKKGVFDHLAKHYKEFEKEPPEWGKSYSAEEQKQFFGEDGDMDEKLKALEDRLKTLEGRYVKSGAKFSQETKDAIGKVTDTLLACHKGIKACHKALSDLVAEPKADVTADPEGGAGEPSDGVEDEPDGSSDGVVTMSLHEIDLATASLADVEKLLGEETK